MQALNPAQKRNVVNQANDILCTGCGTCAGVCPTGAIKMAVKDAVYVPAIAEHECNNCGICATSCAQSRDSGAELDAAVRGKASKSSLLGPLSATYLANARNDALRYSAGSGGVITSFLIYAMEKGMINGALVTRMNKNKPLEPEPFIARTKAELIEASKPKYCPVPANVALKEILSSPTGEKFAVVGLPCHIRGIREAEKRNRELKEKIVLHLGLFCSHTHDFKGTQFLLQSLDVREEEVAQVYYRGFGWPGKNKVVLKDGTEKALDHGSGEWGFFYNSFFFTPRCCMYCHDLTAEQADISVGDPWIQEIMAKERIGKSVVIARSELASRLLESRDLNESVELRSIAPRKVVQAQQAFLHFKKVNLAHRIRFARLFGSTTGKSVSTAGRTSFWNVPVALLSLFHKKYGSQFVSLMKTARPVVKMWVSGFYLLRSLAVRQDARYLQENDLGYNLVILNAAWNNRGDEAAIRAMVESLRSKIPVKSIKMMLLTKDPSHFPFSEVERLPEMPQPDRAPKLLLAFILDLVTLLTLGRVALTHGAKAYMRAIADADIVVHAPGGPQIGDLHSRMYELFTLLRLYIPARRKKPLFFYAPSMGPFSGMIRNRVRKNVIGKACKVVVREEISAKYLREQLGIASDVTADSAFQNEVPTQYLEIYAHNSEVSAALSLTHKNKVVGMSLLDLRWMPGYGKEDDLQKIVDNSLTTLIEWLLAKGFFLLLIPQIFGAHEPNAEMQLLQRVRNLDPGRIFILPNTCDVYVQQALISKLFAVVSMRYHPAVFAAKASVPALCISYQHKTEGLFDKMKRQDLLVRLDELNADTLVERFTYLENNYGTIREELASASRKLERDSEKTTELLVERLESGC